MIDYKRARQFVDARWETDIIPQLVEYIRVPNKSPMFDPDWEAHGYIDEVALQFANWAKAQQLTGMSVEVVRLPGRTPCVLVELEGQGSETVLLYGHLDKQPEMTGWAEGLGPWLPVVRDQRLYGRGGADDGYALFASLTAIAALQQQGRPHSRCVVLIEGSEESGSPDLPFYVDHLRERLGEPGLVICLDSGAGDYERLWLTTSLRGMMAATLRVDILREGVHSGAASGVAASSFRILRKLLDRIEDATSGRLLLDDLHVEIPAERRQQAETAAAILGEAVHDAVPFVAGARPMGRSPVESILNKTWRPTLSYTGAAGLPPLESAGNVLRPDTSLMLSFRFPPTVDAEVAAAQLTAELTRDPPYGAKVSFRPLDRANGWHAPPLAPWLESAVSAASEATFGQPSACIGEGGSIPFMGMLGEKFPEAQFVITGVLGPQSNAHGPNEFLHLPTARRLTVAIADILARHYQESCHE